MERDLPAKGRAAKADGNVTFRRKSLILQKPFVLGGEAAELTPVLTSDEAQVTDSPLENRVFLITNASHGMAKEITIQLSLAMPGCSLIYAPTIGIAKLILKKRTVDMLISSPMLPDGPVDALKSELEAIDPPPPLIVVGDKSELDVNVLRRSAYKVSRIERFSKKQAPAQVSPTPKTKIAEKVKLLGADLRNDLNNPLQEIVAMVFVAKSAVDKNQTTELALDAIDRAAQSMAVVVTALEDKIRRNIG